MSSVIVAGDVSGSVTLQAPSASGTTVITLPTTTGTMMVNGPAFSAYSSAAQSIATVTWTKVQFNVEVFDTNSNYDPTTNYRFTPTVAGYYQVNATLSMNNGATTAYCNLSIYKNGVENKTISYGNYQGLSGCIANLVQMNGTTDYIEIYIFNAEATNRSILGSSPATGFSASMVRSA